MSSLAKRVEKVRTEYRHVFTPHGPVRERHLLRGRDRLINRLQEMIGSRGATIVLYGDRHVGKTSLARIAAAEYTTKVEYNSVDWKGSLEAVQAAWFRKLWNPRTRSRSKRSAKTASVKAVVAQGGLDHETGEVVSEERIGQLVTADQVAKKLGSVARIAIIDDFEQIENEDGRRGFESLIKNLSDHAKEEEATLILIAQVADIRSLFLNFSRIEHCVEGIRVPRLETSTIEELIKKGLEELKLTISPQALEFILEQAQNYPGTAHTYCKEGIEFLFEHVKGGEKEDLVLTLLEVLRVEQKHRTAD